MPSRFLVTIARLALVTVSSSRITTSPALTRSPSCTRTSPTMPPVRCCTFLMFESTTTDPLAMTAPANCVVDAHPPTPPASSATTATPAKRWRRIERREAAASFCIDRSSDIRNHLQGPQRQSRLMSYHLGRDLILGPKGLRASLIHHQQM